jgi:hypothetical protein
MIHIVCDLDISWKLENLGGIYDGRIVCPAWSYEGEDDGMFIQDTTK